MTEQQCTRQVISRQVICWDTSTTVHRFRPSTSQTLASSHPALSAAEDPPLGAFPTPQTAGTYQTFTDRWICQAPTGINQCQDEARAQISKFLSQCSPKPWQARIAKASVLNQTDHKRWSQRKTKPKKLKRHKSCSASLPGEARCVRKGASLSEWKRWSNGVCFEMKDQTFIALAIYRSKSSKFPKAKRKERCIHTTRKWKTRIKK